jgi:hypothetical protein
MQLKNKFNFNQNLGFDFSGGELTSEAGLLLVHEYVENSGIKELLKYYYKEDRSGNFYHTKNEMLYQQILRIIAGIPGNNYIKSQNTDPVFQKIHQKQQASAPTITRWMSKITKKDQKKIENLQQKIIQNFYKNSEEKNIILDIDTTYDPASKNLENSSYNSHYKTTGFSPIVAFDGTTGLPILGNLRPGSQYCSKNTDVFLEKILENISEKKCFIRADSGFACPKIYEILEKRQQIYVIKMKAYGKIINQVQQYFDENILPNLKKSDKKETQIFYHDFKYRAKSWNKSRKIVAKIIVRIDELFPQFQLIITNNLESDSEEIFEFYNQRAVCENYIEEGKNGFNWDHLSHSKFIQNKVRFQVFFLAMTIFKLFQLHSMDKKDIKKSIQTIRLNIFKVAGKLVKGARKFKFKLASCFNYQEIFLNIFQKTQIFPWKFE